MLKIGADCGRSAFYVFAFFAKSSNPARFGCLVKFTSPLPEVALFLPDGGESREPSVNIIDTVLTVLSLQRSKSILYSSKRTLARTSLSPPRRAPPLLRAFVKGAKSTGGFTSLLLPFLPIVVRKYDQRITNSVGLQTSFANTKNRGI